MWLLGLFGCCCAAFGRARLFGNSREACSNRAQVANEAAGTMTDSPSADDQAAAGGGEAAVNFDFAF